MIFNKIRDAFQYKILKFILKYKALFALTFLALATRLYGIVDKDLWFDEVLDIDQAIKPVGQIITEVTITPLHYIIVHVFSLVSTDILFLRLPSVLFGIASVLLLHATIKKISTERVAFMGSLLLAISPMIIEFSQQILHYSFFVFFTIATLYFYIDLLKKPRFELRSLLPFSFFTICNLTTHLSASIVIFLQLIYLFGYYLLQPKLFFSKLRSFWSQPYSKIFMLILLGIFVLFIRKFDYSVVVSLYGRINSNAPIPLGYSLVSQLKTVVLRNFDLPFFEAMFSWFGIGGGPYLVTYLALFLIGTIGLFKRSKSILIFSLTWIYGPFVILHLLRMSHWFEEKYFIFIIPVYLYVIAEGAIQLLDGLLRKTANGYIRSAIYAAVCIIFVIITVIPIQSRTTYGFKVIGDPLYSWKKAIEHTQKLMNDGDKLFALDDKFLKVYLGNKTRNQSWFSEEDLIHYAPSRYNDLINSSNNHFYISIPDIYDMRIGTLITADTQGLAGGFNTYKVKFIKNSPTIFEGTYSESFMKMNYLKDAYDWNNVYLTYNTENNIGLPQTEKENTMFLAPKKPTNAYISYKFLLNQNVPQRFLKVTDINTSQNTIDIETRMSDGSFARQIPISERKFKAYRERIFDLTQAIHNSVLDLTFRFNYKQPSPYNSLVSGLKSFTLASSLNSEPLFVSDASGDFIYDAELETKKNQKWVTDTYESFGWIQTRFGVLYRYAGNSDNGLIYRFTIPPNTQRGILTTKTYTKGQSLIFSISNDDRQYTRLAKNTNELKEIEHTYSIQSTLIMNQEYLFIRVQSEEPNQFAALRNFKLTLR